MNKIFETFLNKSGKEKITIVVLIGILLLIIVLPTEKKETLSEPDNTAVAQNLEQDTSASYESYIEEKLEAALSKVEGVGDVKAVVVLKNSKEKILAADESVNTDNVTESDGTVRNTQAKDTTNIYYDTDNGSQPYVKLENMPEVEGVVIVAKGGGNGSVAAEITSAIEALLGIPAHKVKVLKMSS